ncbi:uncharacterized protein LOC130895066 [Diorhabda carinulata]|uniref:uncharacterized protein LOC130895066 n=1 Tax=Diorhabda carinulata TaxID=1163345 RepID=UPI0025A04137|nr:uncharacterized protein LOC130895066 [Diorhabda carinulata]
MDKKALDNKANQKNYNNDAYWKTRGHSAKPNNWNQPSKSTMSKQDQDYRSKQLNPNNKAYYDSRKN